MAEGLPAEGADDVAPGASGSSGAAEADAARRDDDSYETYFQERSALVDAAREGARSFDKAILTVSSAALAFSLTAVKEAFGVPVAGTTWLLVAGWIGFCLSIVSTVASFLTSQVACDKQVEILEEAYFGDEEGDPKRGVRGRSRWATATLILNVCSALAFVGGLAFLAVFCLLNV